MMSDMIMMMTFRGVVQENKKETGLDGGVCKRRGAVWGGKVAGIVAELLFRHFFANKRK